MKKYKGSKLRVDLSRRQFCRHLLTSTAAILTPIGLATSSSRSFAQSSTSHSIPNNASLSLLAVGDLILGGNNPDQLFDLARPALTAADILIGQVEAPFTNRSVEKYYVEIPTEIYATESFDPNNMRAFANAGFDVMTLAGNHIWDSGVPGIQDTIEGLNALGIKSVGAGMNIDAARRPIILNKKGHKVGFLSYNCTGPKISWATPEKPGCAYIHVVSAYELEHPTPGAEPMTYALALPPSVEAMKDDVRELRMQCDVVVVAFHKGLGFVPAKLAMYEQQVSYAAIDAGADLVLGHHAHMLRGIEFYQGKPIYHGLGHFVVSKRPGTTATWARKNFGQKHGELLGPYVQPDPEYPNHPYHPETLKTMIADVTIVNGLITEVAYLPCLINKLGQPEILKQDQRGQALFDYVDAITSTAQLNTKYQWQGNKVMATPV